METKNTGNGAPAACAWCRGTGRWQVARGTQAECVVCAGQGRVAVTGRAAECRQCRGSGRSDRVNPCLTCAGTGWENVVGQ